MRPTATSAAADRLLDRALDSEVFWQIARVLAYHGERARALEVFDLSLERGFVIYRILTRTDPWLDSIRTSPGFAALLERAEARYRAACKAFGDAGGKGSSASAPQQSPSEREGRPGARLDLPGDSSVE